MASAAEPAKQRDPRARKKKLFVSIHYIAEQHSSGIIEIYMKCNGNASKKIMFRAEKEQNKFRWSRISFFFVLSANARKTTQRRDQQ